MAQLGHKDPVPFIVPAVLIMASAASILSTDLYAPSLPHLAGYFATSAEMVQLTLSLNVAAFALAQLVHGPLSDRVGRRRVILLGMTGFVLFSLACALAQSIELLIAARILQGVAAATEAVVIYAVIRDLYDQAGSVRILAIYGMTIAVAPALGPVIGGYVHVLWGWQANFYLLAVFALGVTLLIWRFLPETTTPDPRALEPRRLIRGYAALLARRQFVVYALICGAVLGVIYAFITAGPFVLIDRLGVKTQHYGYYQAVIVLAFFFGSLAANRGIGRLGLERMLRWGLAIVALGGASLPAALLAGWESASAITAALSVATFGMGLIFATAPVRALDAATGGRGVAAAMIGALEMGGGALGAFMVTLTHDGTAWPLAITVAILALLAGVIYIAFPARPMPELI